MKKWLNIFSFLCVFIFGTPEVFAETVTATPADFMSAIRGEFANQGYEDEMDLEIYGGQTSFQFENAKGFKIMVSNLNVDELNGKFSCFAEVFVDGKLEKKTDLQGRYFVISNVYVPARNLQKGDVIAEADLKQIAMRQSKVKPVYLTDKSKIVDMEAKKPLREGRLISSRDIGKHTLIKKGDTVNMLYQAAGIQIVAKGQALSDGGKGDKIEVMNTKSKKNIFVIIIDKDNVQAE
ncbi:MAG: flagellar basal body P-ring formation chaperone FlgA [Alphaproteobacteria bacterium]